MAYNSTEAGSLIGLEKETVEKVLKRKLLNPISCSKLEPLEISRELVERFNAVRLSNPQLDIEITFHGLTFSIPSSEMGCVCQEPVSMQIILATDKQGHPVINGQAYGSGIYVSSDPHLSLGYVRGKCTPADSYNIEDERKMFVCALLVGDTQKVTSHGVIRVVSDPAYVLPCFVLHYSGHNPEATTMAERLLASPGIFCLLQFIVALSVAYLLVLIIFLVASVGLVVASFQGLTDNEIYRVLRILTDVFIQANWAIIRGLVATEYAGILLLAKVTNKFVVITMDLTYSALSGTAQFLSIE